LPLPPHLPAELCLLLLQRWLVLARLVLSQQQSFVWMSKQSMLCMLLPTALTKAPFASSARLSLLFETAFMKAPLASFVRRDAATIASSSTAPVPARLVIHFGKDPTPSSLQRVSAKWQQLQRNKS
jgi:hypothetical protein